jgi:hypothetical protein
MAPQLLGDDRLRSLPDKAKTSPTPSHQRHYGEIPNTPRYESFHERPHTSRRGAPTVATSRHFEPVRGDRSEQLRAGGRVHKLGRQPEVASLQRDRI